MNEQADEKRGLADELNAAAAAITAVGVTLSLRNPGSLFAKAQEWSMQIWGMGTRLTAGLLAQSASSDNGTVDEFQTAQAQGVSELQDVEDVRSGYGTHAADMDGGRS